MKSRSSKSRQRFTPGRIEKNTPDIWTAFIDDRRGKNGCIWLCQIEVRGSTRAEAKKLRAIILKALEGQ